MFTWQLWQGFTDEIRKKRLYFRIKQPLESIFISSKINKKLINLMLQMPVTFHCENMPIGVPDVIVRERAREERIREEKEWSEELNENEKSSKLPFPIDKVQRPSVRWRCEREEVYGFASKRLKNRDQRLQTRREKRRSGGGAGGRKANFVDRENPSAHNPTTERPKDTQWHSSKNDFTATHLDYHAVNTK